MTEKREWDYITVRFDNGQSFTIYKSDFEKMEQIKDVLEALTYVKNMKRELDRLLGGVDL